MKFLPAQLSYLFETTGMRRNLNLLFRFLLLLAGMVVTYSVVFHVIMEQEGQNHSPSGTQESGISRHFWW